MFAFIYMYCSMYYVSYIYFNLYVYFIIVYKHYKSQSINKIVRESVEINIILDKNLLKVSAPKH